MRNSNLEFPATSGIDNVDRYCERGSYRRLAVDALFFFMCGVCVSSLIWLIAWLALRF